MDLQTEQDNLRVLIIERLRAHDKVMDDHEWDKDDELEPLDDTEKDYEDY